MVYDGRPSARRQGPTAGPLPLVPFFRSPSPDHDEPKLESQTTMDSRLEIAQRQIEFARNYTLGLLEDIGPDQWFSMPTGAPTHLAWQVGHLAMAEYGLVLFRQRGRQPVDTELMNSSFRKRFSRGSTVSSDAADYPEPAAIREVLEKVHAQAMKELPALDPSNLDNEVDMPYAGYPTNYGALLFCAHHEMLHAGQIGLFRRLLNKDPLR